jgi:hypothetical protein
MVTASRQANKEFQMTAVVIINIVFAVSVLVGMLSLLGRAIVADHRATTQDLTPSRDVPAVRARRGAPVRRRERLTPAL